MLEALAYVDDIFIVYNSKDHSSLQASLDQLIAKLVELKLKVSIQKCGKITVCYNRRGQTNRTQPPSLNININGQSIPVMTNMNILEITINNNAMFDRIAQLGPGDQQGHHETTQSHAARIHKYSYTMAHPHK